ncbi:glutathione S-transferase family protein [Caenispirillum bisanense]|uniref:Glutathione S-transferase n=1 Tax=Caenispirillum bisanense TaxID=414052 RepID=A0A286GMK1_9PROT|nr:glutathione S-transferase family protein [Caenispirillum bisanense]SOD96775.1 Glutathione S-transferase [Caenispirillum bisanense]
MILIGRNLSPFTRRVAISLHLLDMPFERRELATATQVEEIRAYNPLARVPALVLDDGEILVDSSAILDHLDEVAGPDRRLTPAAGAARRTVNRLVAFALGAMEKGVTAYYELNRRPADVQWPEGAARADVQVRGGLDQLEAAAQAADTASGGWLVGDRIGQADISAVVALDFIRAVRPGLLADGELPALDALARRCAALPAFAATVPQTP